MGFDAARASIEMRAAALWVPPPPLVFEASGVVPPAGAPWARLTVRETDGGQITLGPEPVMRWRGRIFCDVFVPPRDGTGGAVRIGDQFRPIFERAQFDEIRCAECTPQSLGEADGWWHYQVSVPYYRDERSTTA